MKNIFSNSKSMNVAMIDIIPSFFFYTRIKGVTKQGNIEKVKTVFNGYFH